MRRLFVVRHAEREDNINHSWQKSYPGFKYDNTPLSDRGRSQARDLEEHFENINISSLYASPFDRTMETASILLGKHKTKIRVEPGLLEALYLCCDPPSYWSAEKLSEKFGRVDLDYTPVCSAPLPKEKSGDQGCIPRVTKAVKGILERDKNAENIVLVAHGASIGAVHSALGYDYCYVGQATITVFEEDSHHKFRLKTSGDFNHLSKDNRKNLRAY